MYNSFKRYFSLFILIGLLSAIPTLANTVNAKKNKGSNSFVVNLQDKKSVSLPGKFTSINIPHSYNVDVKEDETVILTVHTNSPTSVTIKSPSGEISHKNCDKMYQVALTGKGTFNIEIKSEQISFYRIIAAKN
jgi:hypothetical protein